MKKILLGKNTLLAGAAAPKFGMSPQELALGVQEQ